jgi:hypothetical protein
VQGKNEWKVAVIAGLFWPDMPLLPVGAKENDSAMLKSQGLHIGLHKKEEST